MGAYTMDDDREGPMLPRTIRAERRAERDAADQLLDDGQPLPPLQPGQRVVDLLPELEPVPTPAPSPAYEGVLSSFASLTEAIVKPAADLDLARQIGRLVRERGVETGRLVRADGPALFQVDVRLIDGSVFRFTRSVGQERWRRDMQLARNGRRPPSRES